jgi:hypothetical protein
MNGREDDMAIDIDSLSVKDIMEMDPNDLYTLPEPQLRKVATKLVSASNKRLKRLEKASLGKYSPAYINATENRTKFSVKHISRKQYGKLEQEVADMKTFLSSKTSSVRGWKKLERETYARLGGNVPKNMRRKFWRMYRKYAESHAGLITKDNSNRILQLLRQIYIEEKIHKEDDVLINLEDLSTKLYEKEISEKQHQRDTKSKFDSEGFHVK